MLRDMTRDDRRALSSLRTELHSRILEAREKQDEADRMKENWAQIELSLLDQAAAVDLCLEASSPYLSKPHDLRIK